MPADPTAHPTDVISISSQESQGSNQPPPDDKEEPTRQDEENEPKPDNEEANEDEEEEDESVSFRGCICSPKLDAMEAESLRIQVPHSGTRVSREAQDQAVQRILLRRVWPAGSVVRVKFLRRNEETKALEPQIIKWVTRGFEDLPFSFHFVAQDDDDSGEEKEETQVRVTFIASEGNWGFIGREVECATNQALATLNIGDPITQSLVLHMFGHAAGLIHTRAYDPRFPVSEPSQFDDPVVLSSMNGPNTFWSYEQTKNGFLDVFNTWRVLYPGLDIGLSNLMATFLPPAFWKDPSRQMAQTLMNARLVQQPDLQFSIAELNSLEYLSDHAFPSFSLLCPPVNTTTITGKPAPKASSCGLGQPTSRRPRKIGATRQRKTKQPRDLPSFEEHAVVGGVGEVILSSAPCPGPHPSHAQVDQDTPDRSPWPLGTAVALGGLCVVMALVRATRQSSGA